MHILNISTSAESFHGHISKQNDRFMGGLTRDKNSYLAPFSRYLHIYAPIHEKLYHSTNFHLKMYMTDCYGYGKSKREMPLFMTVAERFNPRDTTWARASKLIYLLGFWTK
eukprot:sb/3477148/